MENVVVTIVMPAYNASMFIANSICSVLSQSLASWELIVVDDSSDDDTVAIVEEYASYDARIRLIKLVENSGAAVARNVAIRVATGRYISFLDSDDRWLPQKLEVQLAFAQKNDAAFIFSAYRRVDEAGKGLGEVEVPESVSYRELFKTNHIGCLTAMYDTQKLGKNEMPLIRKRQDLGLWLKLLKKTPVAYGQQEVLATYTVRSDSISANKCSASAYQWKVYRDVEQLNLLASCYYFTHYAIRGVLKSRFPFLARALKVMNKVGEDSK